MDKKIIEPIGSLFKYEEIKKLDSGSQGNVYLFWKVTKNPP